MRSALGNRSQNSKKSEFNTRNSSEWDSMAFNVIKEFKDFHNKSLGFDEDKLTINGTLPPYVNITFIHYPCILEDDLVALTSNERITFAVIVATLGVLSLCGNISTICVNCRRQMRPLFRMCILSLAFADILNTVSLCTTYCGQFAAHYVQLWLLGPVMCRVVPFFTISAILSTSMTLVGIALDRYYILRQTAMACWRPSLNFGIVSMACIWAASFFLSTPIFFLYKYIRFYIISDVYGDGSGEAYYDEWSIENGTYDWSNAEYNFVEWGPIGAHRLSAMCGAYQKDVATYFVTVFCIIFVPCILASIWLNLVIARELWLRRHKPKTNDGSVAQAQGRNVMSQQVSIRIQEQQHGRNFIKVMTVRLESNKEATLMWPKPNSEDDPPPPYSISPTIEENVTPTATPQSSTSTAATERRRRHLRMATIIILLLTLFICLRLPAWIFLVMRMYGSYTALKHWIIFFSFGILNLTSSALNPLFYTFLAETLQYISYIKIKLCSTLCNCCSCVCLCLCGRTKRWQFS